MGFNYPWLFWLGLTLPAILALYILRPRRRQRMVPSTLLWHPVAADLEASRPWQRLQSRLLLWLQLLVAALLVLAAVGLVWFAPTSFRSAIVLVDTSASMRAKEGNGTRFDLARDEVVALAEGLRGGATITIITFDRQPRVLVRDSKNAGEVRRALEKITPSAQAADPHQVLALVQALIKQNDQSRVILVSDGGFGALDDTTLPMEFIPVGKGDANVAIAALNLRPGDTGQAAQVTVVNHGSHPASGLVTLTTGKYPAGSREWQLEPGQAQHLLWPDLPRGVTVSAELKPDHQEMDLLELDNRAWAVTGHQSKRKILLVTDGNIFLEQVLTLMPRAEVYMADRARYELLLHGVYPYDITVLDGLAGPMPPGAVLLVDPPAGSPVPGLNVGAAVSNLQLTPRPGSPLLKHVDLSEVSIREARAVEAGPGWSPDLVSDKQILLTHGEVDGGRMVVWSVDLHRSDLPLRPAFPVLMQNTIDWLLPPGLGIPQEVRPGDEVKIIPPPLTKNVVVEGDGTVWEQVPPFPPPPWIPAEPGLYRLMADREGGSMVYEIAVNGYQATESQLKVRDPRKSAAANTVGEKQPDHKSSRALPLTQWLAMAALLVIMLEWGVASRGR